MIVVDRERNYKQWKDILSYYFEIGELAFENKEFLGSILSADKIKQYLNAANPDKIKENLNHLFAHLRDKFERCDDYPEGFKKSPYEETMLEMTRTHFKNMCDRWGKNVEYYSVKYYERKKVHLFLGVVFENLGPLLLEDAESRVCYKKYQTYDEGNYYCESPVLDLYVENIKRGKLYKRTPKDLNNKSEFCYDKDGRLIIHKWVTKSGKTHYYEIMIHLDTQILHIQYEPPFDNDSGYLSKISLQTYENDLITAFEMSHQHRGEIWEFIDETYEYEKGCLNISWALHNTRGFEQSAVRDKYIYLRDDENLIYGYKKKTYYGDGELNEAQQYCEHHNVVLPKEEYDKRNNWVTPISRIKRKDTGMDAVRWHRPNYFNEK